LKKGEQREQRPEEAELEELQRERREKKKKKMSKFPSIDFLHLTLRPRIERRKLGELCTHDPQETRKSGTCVPRREVWKVTTASLINVLEEA